MQRATWEWLKCWRFLQRKKVNRSQQVMNQAPCHKTQESLFDVKLYEVSCWNRGVDQARGVFHEKEFSTANELFHAPKYPKFTT